MPRSSFQKLKIIYIMEYLLKNTTDKKERAYLINYFLEQFRTTLYRQTMFAEFEEKINQLAQNGEGITADVCCALYRQLRYHAFSWRQLFSAAKRHEHGIAANGRIESLGQALLTANI